MKTTKSAQKKRHKFAPVRTRNQREIDLAFVAREVLRGSTECEIADSLSGQRNYSLSRSTIHNDIVSLRKAWSESATDDAGEQFGLELARINAVEKSAWSKFDALGEAAFLTLVLKSIQARVTLLGLSRQQPQRLELSAPDGSPFEYAVLEVPERTFLDRNA